LDVGRFWPDFRSGRCQVHGQDSRAAEEAELFVQKSCCFPWPEPEVLFEHTACCPLLGAGFFMSRFMPEGRSGGQNNERADIFGEGA